MYWLILFAATTIPGKQVPNIGVSDKIEHFAAYSVLSFLLYLTFISQQKIKLLYYYPLLFTILVSALYGVLDELHQILIPGRSCDTFDIIADFMGALLGILIVTQITKIPAVKRILSFD